MGLKKTSALLIVISTMALMACGKKNRDNNNDLGNGQTSGGIVVDVPTAEACLQQNRTSPQGSMWDPNQQQSYGFHPYDWNRARNYGSSNGFCGCQPTYQPACGGSVGMICVPIASTPNYNWAWWQWNQNSQSFNHFAGYDDQPYYGHQGHGWRQGSSCAQQIGQVCDVLRNTGCGYGSCQPVQQGSPVGVCVR